MLGSRFDTAVACADPECLDDTGQPSWAEPEQDGDHVYFECVVCGYTFGYERLQTAPVAVDSGGVCAVGVPESLRRFASAGMDQALASQGPLLQIGRRPDASAS